MGGLFDDDPGYLNQFMVQHFIDYDFYNNVRPDETTRDVATALNITGMHFNVDYMGSTDVDDLETILCQNQSPILVGVPSRISGKFPGHYVLVTGEQVIPNNGGGVCQAYFDSSNQCVDFTIADPFGDPANAPSKQPYSTLSQYRNYLVWGFVDDPPGDMSGMDFSISQGVELLITGPSGQSTGFDPKTASVLKQIPHSGYVGGFTDDDEAGAFTTGNSHALDLFQPLQGTYIATVTDLELGVYTLSLRAFSQDGSSQPPVMINGVANRGSTSTFQVAFASSSGSATPVLRIATFQSAVADINNALELGLIDNAGIANSLSQKIQAAQTATGPARNNILNAFKNDVNAQTGKHITGVAPQVLLQDADSLISRNP